MKKSLLIASTFLLGVSGFAMAGGHPSFTDADTDKNGSLDVRELTTAFPTLELEESATSEVSAADVKQVLPKANFEDEDVVNAVPIGEEQYKHIVDAMTEQMRANAVTSIE